MFSLQPLVGRLQPTWAAIDAGLVVAVVAEVGADEVVVRRRLGAPQVSGHLRQVDVVGGAGRVVDDRVEVDERVVARRVLVADLGALGGVHRVQIGVAAARRLSRGLGRHVLHVALPGQPAVLELVGDRLHLRRRIHAAGPEHLAVGRRSSRQEVVVEDAVGLGLRVRGLAADHGDVVVEAEVAGRVVVRQEVALRRQPLRQVLGGALGTKGLVGVLVLQHDDEDVLDLR